MAVSREAILLEDLTGSSSTDVAANGTVTSNGNDISYAEPEEQHRVFRIKDRDVNEESAFIGNKISTAKYNVVSFLPKFLYEQFSRNANLFFLFTALIQQIPNVSPMGRWTTIVPLFIVLCMTAVKELLEDWKRHSADSDVNRRRVKVFKQLTFETIQWTQVRVGDIVKVVNNHYFPADMVLLASSEPDALCYVETANLDGETNLKIRQGLPATANIIAREAVRRLAGSVECEPPNERLYKFVGNLNLETADGTTKLPLGPDQLLQRGAQLKNTPWVYGLVVYTGHESKLLKNAKATPIKRSNVDDVYNRQIVYLFVTLITLSLISTIVYAVWIAEHRDTDWYLGFDQARPLSAGLTFFTFIILYNNLIPISLIITLDIVKYFQALIFINNDLDIYHAESDTPARAQTSALNEELGQVEYIFSDKTGTLTQNEMILLKCSVAGIKYGNNIIEEGQSPRFNDPALLDNLTNGHKTASVIREYLTLLAVCHTVVPERDKIDPGIIIYQAASPDESALVEAVKQLGFSFNVRQPESVTINALGQDQTYEILNVLEFNSTRKRMSVVVRCPDGKIKVLCKGADSVIYERLAPKQPFKELTTQHLKEFASDGLRTLCLGMAVLSEEEYERWNKKYHQAATAIEDRFAKLDAVAEQVERNLFLLGATAIEDRLQDGVPEAIRSLAQAGIKIWVCTGDKQETAINIGYSCRLLTANMTLLVANAYTDEDAQRWLETQLAQYRGRADPDRLDLTPLALIIDGATLEFTLQDHLRDQWLELAKMCKAVVACRVSPLQKAEIVRLVKESESAITLSIGDGANDVPMLQSAHVGVGISGKEGLQAARAGDYAIGQFRFLKKLLLVHGAWSYRRVTMLILYSFWKNITLYLMELWFAFDNGFSGQILFEKWTIATYNVAFTLLPPLAIGVFDQHLSAETLMNMPQLYITGQKRLNFNTRVFWGWTFNSIYHSLMLYWLPLQAFKQGAIHADGVITGQWLFGHVVYSIVIYTVILKGAMVTNYWTKWTHVFMWGSALIWIIYTFAYFNLWPTQAFGGIGYEVYGVDVQMYRSGVVWFSFILFPVMALFTDAMWILWRRMLFPGEEDRLRAMERRSQLVPQMPDILADNGSPADMTHLGYAFSQNENTDSKITQAELVRRYDTTIEKPEGD
eukprot:TRINITY_DN11817_c0_g1_i2.p1 TRINITY_DN11817_c0_g1~~TRINITY_DN11817_c0_g1_i2.p1  ORF type:complete len:1157 (+),score=344.14 TRINITY_DN11817_c0_g1_i2:140-3610(+)